MGEKEEMKSREKREDFEAKVHEWFPSVKDSPVVDVLKVKK